VQSLHKDYISRCDILQYLIHSVILPDTSQRYTETVDKCRVGDQDIGAVCFCRDAIVSVDNCHAVEVNIVAVDRVGAICVRGWIVGGGCAVYVDILHEDVGAFKDRHCPIFVHNQYSSFDGDGTAGAHHI
jgi:hypothetical protein